MKKNKKPLKKKNKKLLEKDIVNYIIRNWTSLFDNNIKLYRTEVKWLNDYRCDISAYVEMTLDEKYGYNEPYKYNAPIFIEVKFNKNDRDLIYEIKKALTAVNRIGLDKPERLNVLRNPAYVGVISDDFSDEYIYNFLIENNIHLWQIDIKNNDINTLKLTYIETFLEETACSIDEESGVLNE